MRPSLKKDQNLSSGNFQLKNTRLLLASALSAGREGHFAILVLEGVSDGIGLKNSRGLRHIQIVTLNLHSKLAHLICSL